MYNDIDCLFVCFVCFLQVRGHQRNSSDTKEFHEVTKRDAQIHFEQELKSLLLTVPSEELNKFYSNEMQRFASLFGRFLQEEGPSVEWDRIQKLPTEAVKDYATLSAPKDSSTVCMQVNLFNGTKNRFDWNRFLRNSCFFLRFVSISFFFLF